jgi:DNA-binding transcriptional regulator PaaX
MPTVSDDTLEVILTLLTLAVREWKIPITARRLVWYCHWLRLPYKPSTVRAALGTLLRQGRVQVIREGRYFYYKPHRKK